MCHNGSTSSRHSACYIIFNERDPYPITQELRTVGLAQIGLAFHNDYLPCRQSVRIQKTKRKHHNFSSRNKLLIHLVHAPIARAILL